MKPALVYKLVNRTTGAFYVGCTTLLLRQRANIHTSQLRRGVHDNKVLQAAWNEHGEAAFEFVVVEQVPAGSCKDAAEERHLAMHVGKPYCYNISHTARSPMKGRTPTAATRAKMRALKTGLAHGDAARAKISAARLGKPLSDVHRAKLRMVALVRQRQLTQFAFGGV